MNPDSFLEQAVPILHGTTAGHNDRLLKMHIQHLETYGRHLDELYTTIGEMKEQDTAASLLKCLHTFIQSTLSDIRTISTIETVFSGENLWNGWEKRLSGIVADHPPVVSLNIPDSFWLARPEDSIYVKNRKWLKRFAGKIVYAGIGFSNFFRSLFRQPPITPPTSSRVFHLQLFAANYASIPFAHHLIGEWHLLLRHIALQFYTLHESDTELHSFFRSVLNGENIRMNTLNQGTAGIIRALNDHRNTLNTLIQKSREYHTAGIIRSTEAFESMAEKFKEKWEQAGTFVLPGEEFGIRSFGKRKKEAELLFDRLKNGWNNHFTGESEDWQKDIELSAVQVSAIRSCIDSIERIKNTVGNTIIPPLQEIHEMIAVSLDRFRRISPIDATALLNAILEENQTLVKSLRQEKLPAVMAHVTNAGIETAFNEWIPELQKEITSLRDTYIIMKRRAIDTLPPESETDKVTIKDLIREEVFLRISVDHASIAKNIHARLERTHREISEIDQIVEFTLHSAAAILEENPPDETIGTARSVVIEGLERTHFQIDELQDNLFKIVDIVQSGLPEITRDFSDTLQEMADNDKVFELKLRLARAKTSEKFRKILTAGYSGAKSVAQASVPVFVQTAGRFRHWYARFRKITGLTAPVQSIDVQLAQYLTESYQKISGLPYIYRRLFSSDPLVDSRFFGARSDEMESIRKNVGLWSSGKNMSMVIVGENGSGKTTLMNFIVKEILSGSPIIRINLNHTTCSESGFIGAAAPALGIEGVGTIDELEARINERDEKRICILENMHNLFLRTVEGLDTIERFLLLVLRTQKNILWLITSNLYGWNYLNNVLHVSQYFFFTLFLDTLSKEDISDIISRRHRVSGYGKLYEIPENVRRLRKFGRLSPEEQQAFLENRLFDQIADLSSGNIRVAILFWLTSIKDISKENIILNPEITFDHTFIYQLPSKELFTLAAIIQHENLLTRDHAAVFNREIKDSVMILNRMLNRGLLVKDGDEYMIHPFLYRPVARALKAKNILQ